MKPSSGAHRVKVRSAFVSRKSMSRLDLDDRGPLCPTSPDTQTQIRGLTSILAF
ncbi:hypothetical protein ACJ72_07591 [Emergomyces africanus]|uniref:Uncharacterized protein n=1 Tax=Emergomyces africanus TaxID=1955775 RepID=A0A1B7NMQ6_9EURO|nr:hypothetical protein ACJ72_07591 [Emergomyces africanus]